jgi:hypothetical protein
MRKLGCLLTITALGLVASPATAATPPGLKGSDESTCGTIVHSNGNSAYVDGQHYAILSFSFAANNGEDGFMGFGNKNGITGEQLSCDIAFDEGTLTVTLAALPT